MSRHKTTKLRYYVNVSYKGKEVFRNRKEAFGHAREKKKQCPENLIQVFKEKEVIWTI